MIYDLKSHCRCRTSRLRSWLRRRASVPNTSWHASRSPASPGRPTPLLSSSMEKSSQRFDRVSMSSGNKFPLGWLHPSDASGRCACAPSSSARRRIAARASLVKWAPTFFGPPWPTGKAWNTWAIRHNHLLYTDGDDDRITRHPIDDYEVDNAPIFKDDGTVMHAHTWRSPQPSRRRCLFPRHSGARRSRRRKRRSESWWKKRSRPCILCQRRSSESERLSSLITDDSETD